MRIVFNLGILTRVVLDVIEHSLCGSLRLQRGACRGLGRAQSAASLRGLHLAKARRLGIACGYTCCCGSRPAVCRRVSIIWIILLHNRNTLAILVLRKATIDFLLP